MEEKLKEKDEELKYWLQKVPKSIIEKEISIEKFRKSNKSFVSQVF